ncbi:CPBP family intramembrane glutamic endopeptidase [Pseudoxanthomonas sp. J35]|uniref:CPBP family intramembrane glutamic endopeptidase n=1 Tax=Pseudoxanthomonas sp. J35 TaxID=935852 RepID=UPI000A078EF3|nr:CPBP family intramembrane glutamic endopeptidase [Pseudoxanthomonas sp. J35]
MDVERIAGWNFDGKFIFSSILLSSLIAPLIEEFFFRGVAIWKSNGKEALLSAIVASSMFAAAHPDRWLSVFAFSLIASFVYVRLGFLACYIFHFSYNIGNFVFLLILSQLNQGA